MFLRPFNFYLSASMLGDLFALFLCAYFLLGFIGYGVECGAYPSEEHYIVKIIFMIVLILLGPIALNRSMRENGFHKLRFW